MCMCVYIYNILLANFIVSDQQYTNNNARSCSWPHFSRHIVSDIPFCCSVQCNPAPFSCAIVTGQECSTLVLQLFLHNVCKRAVLFGTVHMTKLSFSSFFFSFETALRLVNQYLGTTPVRASVIKYAAKYSMAAIHSKQNAHDEQFTIFT